MAENIADPTSKEIEALQESSHGPTPSAPPLDDSAPPPFDASPIPTEAPPTYESLFGQIREVKEQSNSTSEFIKNLLSKVCGVIGSAICGGLCVALPVSMIVMGALYFEQCPAEQWIPIYLIVGGVIGTTECLIFIYYVAMGEKEGPCESCIDCIFGLLICKMIGWFIAGNVLIYRTFANFQGSDPTLPSYCHSTLYWYAFWMTTAVYILVGLVLMCFCGVCLWATVEVCKEGLESPEAGQKNAEPTLATLKENDSV